jgi:hypothetical protein
MLAASPVPSPEQSMNGFPLDPPESALPPLGPAISPHPSPRRSSLGELAEPLAPFGVRAARPAPPEPAAPLAPVPDLDLDVGLDLAPLAPVVPEIDAIDSGSGAVDDLPWIELDEPLVESVMEEPAEPQEPREPAVPALRAEAEEWDEWGAAGDTPEASDPEEPAHAPAASVGDSVAARLEEIARTLREHGPAGLLVGEHQDPLHLLIAGYALGHAAAEERGGAGEG